MENELVEVLKGLDAERLDKVKVFADLLAAGKDAEAMIMYEEAKAARDKRAAAR